MHDILFLWFLPQFHRHRQKWEPIRVHQASRSQSARTMTCPSPAPSLVVTLLLHWHFRAQGQFSRLDLHPWPITSAVSRVRPVDSTRVQPTTALVRMSQPGSQSTSTVRNEHKTSCSLFIPCCCCCCCCCGAGAGGSSSGSKASSNGSCCCLSLSATTPPPPSTTAAASSVVVERTLKSHYHHHYCHYYCNCHYYYSLIVSMWISQKRFIDEQHLRTLKLCSVSISIRISDPIAQSCTVEYFFSDKQSDWHDGSIIDLHSWKEPFPAINSRII